MSTQAPTPSHHPDGPVGLQALPRQAHDQRLPLRLVELDVLRQAALRPHEAALVQAPCQRNRQLHGVLVGEVRVRCKPALL